MAAFGYSYVSETAFVASREEFARGAWGEVTVEEIPADQLATVLITAPSVVALKALMVQAIDGLVTALSPDETPLEEADAAWDSVQRQFAFAIAIEEESRYSARRAAAAQLRNTLLLGGGTGQTALGYQEEVDFGLKQIRLAEKEAVQKALETTELTSRFNAVRTQTENLAELVRNAPIEVRSPRSTRRRVAHRSCVRAFNLAHAWLNLLMEANPDPATRERLAKLREPLQALLDRVSPDAPLPPADPVEPVDPVQE